ncbi:hypothetical protein GQ53DRAFT_88219 [Thozetella sp. PMI_491]|nr:hypothetical protein GQ53DRAFT_88219 [Thozetella sp. PMI_491]
MPKVLGAVVWRPRSVYVGHLTQWQQPVNEAFSAATARHRQTFHTGEPSPEWVSARVAPSPFGCTEGAAMAYLSYFVQQEAARRSLSLAVSVLVRLGTSGHSM